MASSRPRSMTREVLPSEGIERRRAQNRIAQRKFRQKRKLREGLGTAHLRSDTTLPAFGGSECLPSNQIDVEMDTAFNVDDPTVINAQISTLDLAPDPMQGLPWEDLHLENSTSPGLPRSIEDTSSLVELYTPSSKTSNDDPLAPLRSHRRADSNSSLDDWLTSLHIAAARGHARILSMLLSGGNFNINEKDGEGKTALHHAASENHEPCVRVLLEHGAKVDVSDGLTGWTSLHWAVLNKNEAILQLLLENDGQDCEGQRNFDVDAFDTGGWTSLHVAVERGFERGVELLLRHGADLGFRARRCQYTGFVVAKDVEAMMRAVYEEKISLNREVEECCVI